jgi:steroid 5-alpha reductase family enzyme
VRSYAVLSFAVLYAVVCVHVLSPIQYSICIGRNVFLKIARVISCFPKNCAPLFIFSMYSLHAQGAACGFLTASMLASSLGLTLYRQAYSFSVGYGFSVFAMGIALLSVFWEKSLVHAALSTSKYTTGGAAPIFLVASIIFYGFRLGSFLLIRELTVPSKQKQIKSFDKTPLLKRVPFSISVAMFYAFMVTPAMYVMQQFANTATPLTKGANQIAFLGAAIAWFGALMEAIADGHKFLVKRGKDESVDFHGPTTGVYAMSRHPNYIAEILYWFGVLLCGIPSFGKSPIAWICSALGFVGIYKTMVGATDRLDSKQEAKYGSQKLYDEWKKTVPKLFPTNPIASLIPSLFLVGGTAVAMKVVAMIAMYATGIPSP